jgi:hypothetical protein
MRTQGERKDCRHQEGSGTKGSREQGPGGRGELEEENGVGGRAKDNRARRGAGIATMGAATETLALGSQGRGTEGITPSGRNGARKSIQRLISGHSETSTIELWKAGVTGIKRGSEKSRLPWYRSHMAK